MPSSIGDLTQSASKCGLFRQFTLPRGSDAFVELPLDVPLSLQVGGRGIIGRRVSLHARSELVAEGIVGFNFQKPSL